MVVSGATSRPMEKREIARRAGGRDAILGEWVLGGGKVKAGKACAAPTRGRGTRAGGVIFRRGGVLLYAVRRVFSMARRKGGWGRPASVGKPQPNAEIAAKIRLSTGC